MDRLIPYKASRNHVTYSSMLSVEKVDNSQIVALVSMKSYATGLGPNTIHALIGDMRQPSGSISNRIDLS